MARGVRVKVNIREVEKLKQHPKVQRRIEHDAKAVAQVAQRLAPKDLGGGAASIHAEPGDPRQGSWYVGADSAHFYMVYQELGTATMDPHPHLRPALDHFQSFVRDW